MTILALKPNTHCDYLRVFLVNEASFTSSPFAANTGAEATIFPEFGPQSQTRSISPPTIISLLKSIPPLLVGLDLGMSILFLGTIWPILGERF